MKLGIRRRARWPLVFLLAVTFGRSLQSADTSPREYRLRFYNTHTNERLDIVYRRGDSYVPEALAKLDHYLRDRITGAVHHFEPRLFDLLYDLTASLNDAGGEIDVICGYRTRKPTNSCEPAAPIRESRSTVSTRKRKPSISACPGWRPRPFGTLRSA
jgi:uncharacterized protein YcbK (DUF882 family)